jgi:O-antigen biosynthesis protein
MTLVEGRIWQNPLRRLFRSQKLTVTAETQLGTQDSTAVDLAWAHRYRFVAPLCRDRKVLDIGQPPKSVSRPVAQLAKTYANEGIAEGVAQPDIILWLDTEPEELVMERAPALMRQLAKGGTLILAGTTDHAALSGRASELRQICRYHACYTERPITGTLFGDARFSEARITVLQDGADRETAPVALHLCSDSPLPTLSPGLLETMAPASLDIAPRAPLSFGAGMASRSIPLSAQDAQLRIVSFMERLLEVEAELLDAHIRTTRLQHELASQRSAASSSGGGWFDVPRTQHEWPLAESGAKEFRSTSPYDRRIDDDVILTARAGEAFFETHRLATTSPDFAGAVAALSAADRQLTLSENPDASIVIPVYGQLAYTLNCIDSLFSHTSRYSAEIIIIDDCSPDTSGDVLPTLPGIRYHRQPKNGGFIRSCNTGGELARGRWVIMLNNDTRAVPGWLDGLLDTFTLFPRAGVVGSKMLYSDGSLQEAGGIIWRDGSAWNYGRGDDPNRPQYCYARQVDYISGASIALPRELWQSLGGFDPHYTPAYCEDADLCLRVVAGGQEVWYQPQSRLVHYEGKTSGTDTKTGVKAYQVVNTKKLFLRWRDLLLTHRRNAEAPFLERERKVAKRILVVDATAPTPNQDAGSVQTVLGLRVCRELGYKAHFVPEDNWLFQPGYITDLQREGVDCAYAPYELGFESYIRRYGWSFDVVMVYRVSVLSKILDQIRAHAPQAAVIFHVADLHFLRMQRLAQLEESEEGLAEAEAMKGRELALIRNSDCTITHSIVEAEILAEEAPGSAVAVWPLMFDYFGTEIGFQARRDVVFLGGYKHSPNIDAVLFFVREILPLLKREEPSLRFIVAGANPTREILNLASDDVVVTGLVEDLRDVFDQARVFVCPLRVGAGAKGKVMSALSYGIPVVSTSIGIEGAGLEEGRHVLVADDPAAFAQETMRVYRDAGLWKRLSQDGQALIRDEFSTAMGVRVFGAAIDKAFRHKLGLD